MNYDLHYTKENHERCGNNASYCFLYMFLFVYILKEQQGKSCFECKASTLINVLTIVCSLSEDVLAKTNKITLEVIKLLQKDCLAHNAYNM